MVLLGKRSDIPELLNAADVFVFPSLQEGLPVALMEAIACGCFCIASRIRGNVDLIDCSLAPNDIDGWINEIQNNKAIVVNNREQLIQQISISHVNKTMKKYMEYKEECIHVFISIDAGI